MITVHILLLAERWPRATRRNNDRLSWLGQDFNRSITTQNNWDFGDVASVEAMLIVSRCWQAGITPPIRLATVADGVGGQAEALSAFEQQVFAPQSSIEDPGLPETSIGAEPFEADESGTPPRVRQWMAGLLDLSARNPLLRIKKGILSFDVAEGTADAIDDLLFTPKKRLVITSPSGLPPTWKDNGVNPDEFLKWSQSTNFDTLVYPPYRTVNRFSQSVEQEFTQRPNFERLIVTEKEKS